MKSKTIEISYRARTKEELRMFKVGQEFRGRRGGLVEKDTEVVT